MVRCAPRGPKSLESEPRFYLLTNLLLRPRQRWRGRLGAAVIGGGRRRLALDVARPRVGSTAATPDNVAHDCHGGKPQAEAEDDADAFRDLSAVGHTLHRGRGWRREGRGGARRREDSREGGGRRERHAGEDYGGCSVEMSTSIKM